MKGSGKTTLGDCCEIVMGQAPEGSAYGPLGSDWPLIAGAGDFGEGVPAPKKSTSIAPKLTRRGDIILAIRASIGEIVLSDGIYCLGRGVAALRAAEGLDPAYLRHWVTHARPVLESKARGATFKQVDRTAIAELELELPRVAEQRRIAEILDQADALRAKRRAALEQVDGLTQAIFLEMFGDPVANPRRWPEEARLGDVAEIVSGVTKGRPLKGRSARAVPYLAVSNVQDRHLDLEVVKEIEATEDEIRLYRLRRNDLLLTEGGDPDKLGRGTVWAEELPECIHQNHIFRVRADDKVIRPVFLSWLVGSARGKKYFLRSAKQTTGIASINMTQLRGFPLLLPPMVLQDAFARRAAAVDKLKASHRASLAHLDALFASLQHRAFRGEL
ncbi:MAG: restriction endonuclease subunit S [Thermoanaerobaculia bacterium]